MPEDSPLDGSELEQIQEPQEQAAETPGEPEQPEQTATAQPPQQPQTPNIPEQFKDYTPEQWFQEWNKTNSQLGRYRQELSNQRQQYQALASYVQPNGQTRQQPQNNPPSSLPGQEARQGQQAKMDFWENPEEVISGIVNQGIRNYELQQTARQQQALQQRAAWIESVDNDELARLRLDEDVNFTDDHEILMQFYAAKDPEIKAKLSSPNLTEQDIRQAVRSLYKKADEKLNGPLADPARLRAFTQAQKQAAMNGAPNPTAGLPSSPSPYGDVPEDVKERWGFLLNGG